MQEDCFSVILYEDNQMTRKMVICPLEKISKEGEEKEISNLQTHVCKKEKKNLKGRHHCTEFHTDQS